MHINKHDIPVKIDVPGAKARQLAEFGVAEGGQLGAEYFTLAAGTDIAPLLKGLKHDACHAPHWGYMIGGDVVVTYIEGTVEHCSGGDLFHWPAGHTVRVEQDAEIILFSPPQAHADVMDHMLAKMANL